jgi:preprotein translocase subunit SecA
LLAWLEQIQPAFNSPDGIFPPYTYKLLLTELNKADADLQAALLDLAARAVQADQDHFLAATLDQIDRAGLDLKNQMDDRTDSLDSSLDGLSEAPEGETRRPNVILDELAGLVRVPFKLDPDQLLQLVEDPKNLADDLRAQVEAFVTSTTIARLANTIEFRLGEPLGLNLADLQELEWDDVARQVEEHVHQALAVRREKLLGAGGQIPRDLEAALERLTEYDEQTKLRLLGLLAQGTSTFFDAKTHRQIRQVFTRLHYIYLAGEMLRNSDNQALEEDVLDHLQKGQQAQRRAFGESERGRLGENAPAIPAEELGHTIQTQIYRQVLLGAITELWVDYLTRVEALRVSVGLEAYAQSDPLVKYKSQASEMFQGLLGDIRAAVISRIFLYQPRAAGTQTEMGAGTARRPEAVAGSGPAETSSVPENTNPAQGSDKKRKRHRH